MLYFNISKTIRPIFMKFNTYTPIDNLSGKQISKTIFSHIIVANLIKGTVQGNFLIEQNFWMALTNLARLGVAIQVLKGTGLSNFLIIALLPTWRNLNLNLWTSFQYFENYLTGIHETWYVNNVIESEYNRNIFDLMVNQIIVANVIKGTM